MVIRQRWEQTTRGEDLCRHLGGKLRADYGVLKTPCNENNQIFAIKSSSGAAFRAMRTCLTSH